MKKLLSGCIGLYLFFSISAFADEEVWVQVRFLQKTQYGPYQSTLNYLKSDYDRLAQDQIDADKQRLIDGFLQDKQNPHSSTMRTQAEVQAEIDRAQVELKNLQTELQAIIDAGGP